MQNGLTDIEGGFVSSSAVKPFCVVTDYTKCMVNKMYITMEHI